MKILRIDHVQLAMPAGQEDLARAFYGDLLGLAEVPKPAALAGRGGVWFECGPVRVHLGIEPEFRPARKAHPAFVVDDLVAFIDRLRRCGHEVADPELLDDNLRTFVYDPFGNRLELVVENDPDTD